MASIVMEVFFFLWIFSQYLLGLYKLKYGSRAIYVHKIRYDTAVSVHIRFAMAFNTATLVSGSVTEKKKKKKKVTKIIECAGKKLFEASCVRNFRNPLFAKLQLFEILGHFQKLFWAKILGVRNFRVFEILGHLPYWLTSFWAVTQAIAAIAPSNTSHMTSSHNHCQTMLLYMV